MLKAEPTAGFQDASHTVTASRSGRWLTWELGVALVAGVSFAASHFSEAEEIAGIAERARPSWLLVAILLQLATSIAQGGIWRVIARAAAFLLPSAGLSGTAAVSKYFEQQGTARPALMASIVISLASYFVMYAVLLVSAGAVRSLSLDAMEAASVTITFTVLDIAVAWLRHRPWFR